MQVYQLLTLILDMGETIHNIKAEKTDQRMARTLIKMGQENNNVLPPDAYANARTPDPTGADSTMDFSWMQDLTYDEEQHVEATPNQPHTRGQPPKYRTPTLPSRTHHNDLHLEDSSDDEEQDPVQQPVLEPTPPLGSSKKWIRSKANPLEDSEDDDQPSGNDPPNKTPDQARSQPPPSQPKRRLKRKSIQLEDTEDDDIPSTNNATGRTTHGKPPPSPSSTNRHKNTRIVLDSDNDEDGHVLAQSLAAKRRGRPKKSNGQHSAK